ncbi:Glycosyltransferase [Melia azedarach]|uniref:Glycosyltransferase n=1 Tax=Melia azedarach TaxID=155640 RepID=A0ACC1XTX1_MELAZ|nr:Glycosyltransferase [Melia azedarach]
MGSEEQVRVLMVTFSYQGHLNPILRLAKLLVSKGLHVTIATTEVARKQMLKPKTSITQDTTRVHFEFFSDGLTDDFDRQKYVSSLLESLEAAGSKNLSNLITNLTTEDKKFSCIITNPFMPWVVDVAAEHNIPCAVLWIQACAVYSIYYRYFNQPQLFPSLENPNEAVELPTLPVLLVKELPSFILPSNPIHFNKLMIKFVQNLGKVKWILGNSFNELEEDIVASLASLKPIIPIGPLVSQFVLGKEETVTAASLDKWRAEDSCIEWLDERPPLSVIYISFGSITELSQNQMDSIAAALKNANRPFLWVIRPQEKKSTELPSGFLEATKDKGLIVKWCSQEKVLMHPAVACFLTHCGWNSTLETVVAGVPAIAYPEWTDQLVDAKLLVDVFKTGVRMKNEEDGTLTAEEVQRCILEVTEGPKATELKKRAMALKDAARKAAENGGSSDQNVNLFINEILGTCF